MNIAIIGGGINGVMSSLALARRGHSVTIFESERTMSATSGASTKLLHGGLRYLEHGAFRLVREGLRERQWWLDMAPDLCARQEILYPIYKDGRRPGWLISAGMHLYDWLAGRLSLGKPRKLTREEVLTREPNLRRNGLLGAWSFFDGTMGDDRLLGRRAADYARQAGVVIREDTAVDRLSENGELWVGDTCERFDVIVNATGPWASDMLERSDIPARFRLDYVRGSHLVLRGRRDTGLLLEYPGESRIFFVMPYQGATLLGTTEIRQVTPDSEPVSDGEADYLLKGYEHYLSTSKAEPVVKSVFSGVRPLIKSSSDPTCATREYAIDVQRRVLTVFGGKWTTARVLGERVADKVEKMGGC